MLYAASPHPERESPCPDKKCRQASTGPNTSFGALQTCVWEWGGGRGEGVPETGKFTGVSRFQMEGEKRERGNIVK